MLTGELEARRQLLEKFWRDRQLAHRSLFKHKNHTPEFLGEIIQMVHFCPTPYALIEAFRGGAKSTTAEEGTSIMAGFRLFRNGIIAGFNLDRAMERLAAIKNHVEKNELLAETFGQLKGPVWSDDEIILSTGARIKALGKGQAVLGVKHLEDRPDFILIDDLDKREEALSADLRKASHDWLMGDLLPAADPDARVIVLATQRHPEDFVGQIKSDIQQARASGEETLWTAVRYPIEHKGPAGERVPTWEDRFPLKRIDQIEASFKRQGRIQLYRMEYLCKADAPEDKTFKSDMLRVEPRPRTWQAAFCMYDPARTVRATSSQTGFAAWSYIGPKIVVWDAWGRLLMPSEIIDSLFEEHETFHPVFMGFEEDGLNEWALQPIRQEQLRRRIVLPLKAMRAPQGKDDFIRGLQPFASARELEFAKDLPELKAQLLAFPSGRKDIPNALAYALRMKPGAPMYDNFATEHISVDMEPTSRPLWLAMNAGSAGTTAALVQFQDGWFRVYADWVRQEEPGACVGDIVREASLECGRGFRVVVPPEHMNKFNNVGLVQAIKRIPLEVRVGTDALRGRNELRALLQRRTRGFPDVLVTNQAEWTLNAMSGGYARALVKNGILADYAEEGLYRVLMEGIECFTGLMTLGAEEEDDRNYRYSSNGQRYASTLRSRE